MATLDDRERETSSDGGRMRNESRTVETASSRPLLKANPALGPGVYAVDPPDGAPSSGNGSDDLPPEAVGGNPMTLGPNDPKRESDEGQPYLDDANPYGRPLVNRQNRPMGGIGTEVDPNDEERRFDRTDMPKQEPRSWLNAELQGDRTMANEAILTRDQQIGRSIEDAIQARLRDDAPPINVAVQGATVTLTGHVANQATKDAINDMARNTDGVINVTDNLVVGNDRSLLDWFMPARDENRDLERADSTGEM